MVLNTPPDRQEKSHTSLVAIDCTIAVPVFFRTSKSTMSAFEKLPREIRDIIYELCLCVDEILAPYPDWPTSGYEPRLNQRKPEAALLALNKQIRAEALPILFGTNTWRIAAGEVDLAKDKTSSLGIGGADTLWDRYGSYIRKVDVKYTRTQYLPGVFNDIIRFAHKLSSNATLNHQLARAKFIHDSVTGSLDIAWATIADALCCCPNIESLHIDTGDLYCAYGCCRTSILQRLFVESEHIAVVKAHVKVSVSGLMDEEERGYIVAWRTRGASGKEKDGAIAHTKLIMNPLAR